MSSKPGVTVCYRSRDDDRAVCDDHYGPSRHRLLYRPLYVCEPYGQTTALLPVFLVAAMALPEMPIRLISLLFSYTLGFMGVISPYATGPAPIYYGSGYISREDFWTLGLIFGTIYLFTGS